MRMALEDKKQEEDIICWQHPEIAELKALQPRLYRTIINRRIVEIQRMKAWSDSKERGGRFTHISYEALIEVFNCNNINRLSINPIEHIDRKLDLIAGMKKLSLPEQRIISLYLKGYRYQEIADIIGYTYDSVKTIKRNAVRRLRKMICRGNE